MRSHGLPLFLLALLALPACSSTPPANWAPGGARVDIPRARWVRPDLVVDLAADGKIFFDGDHVLTIDSAGRVFDVDHTPVALLESDGRVSGSDDEELGRVGHAHASLPGESHAWISLRDTGELVRYDEDGEPRGFGVWAGCGPSHSARQVCTLVSHLVGIRLRAMGRQGGGGVVFGFGMGVRLR